MRSAPGGIAARALVVTLNVVVALASSACGGAESSGPPEAAVEPPAPSAEPPAPDVEPPAPVVEPPAQEGSLRIVQEPPASVAAGELLRPAPQVQLLDAAGKASEVKGVAVTVSAGDAAGGIAGTAVQVTDADGRATFTDLSFTNDAAGTRTLSFSSERRATAVSAPIDVRTVTASGYAITLRFLSEATPTQAAAFERARTRIAQVVTGDVRDTFVRFAAMQGCGNTAIAELVDDLLIWVELRTIDGPGGVLGQAGPCVIRSSSKLPAVGIMQLDTADLQYLETLGQLDALILHEMLHVIGFGVVWHDLGVMIGAGSTDPVFTGAAAREAFLGFDGGASYKGTPVPLENTGGAGTRDSHWRESVLKNELMTGWLSSGAQPLSRTTIASLGDLGYEVDLSRADPLGSKLSQALSIDSTWGALELGHDVLELPLREVAER